MNKGTPADPLREALIRLVDVIDAAGIGNLSNGVQLGATSWYVKASDAMEGARAALATKPAEAATRVERIENIGNPTPPHEHDWHIWPETDGLEQRCSICGAYRRTPEEDKFWKHPTESAGKSPTEQREAEHAAWWEAGYAARVKETESAGKAVQRPVDEEALTVAALRFDIDGGDPLSDQLDEVWQAAMAASDECMHPRLRGFSEWCGRTQAACEVLIRRLPALYRCAETQRSSNATRSDDKAKTEPERGAVQPPAPECRFPRGCSAPTICNRAGKCQMEAMEAQPPAPEPLTELPLPRPEHLTWVGNGFHGTYRERSEAFTALHRIFGLLGGAVSTPVGLPSRVALAIPSIAQRGADLEREAAEYVESVIVMNSGHFTGEQPYVGWKGLGLALSEDYADLKALRAQRGAPEQTEREGFETFFPAAKEQRDGDTYKDVHADIWEGWKARGEWAAQRGAALTEAARRVVAEWESGFPVGNVDVISPTLDVLLQDLSAALSPKDAEK